MNWEAAFQPVVDFALANGYQYDWYEGYRTDRGGVTHSELFGPLRLGDFLNRFTFAEGFSISGTADSHDFVFRLPYVEIYFSSLENLAAIKATRKKSVEAYAKRRGKKRESGEG